MSIYIWIIIVIILGCAFSSTTGGKDKIAPNNNKKSDFRDNEFDDEIEDYGRIFDDNL